MKHDAIKDAFIAATKTAESLRETLKSAGHVEALYLLPLIGDAARLEMRIEALKNAMNEDK